VYLFSSTWVDGRGGGEEFGGKKGKRVRSAGSSIRFFYPPDVEVEEEGGKGEDILLGGGKGKATTPTSSYSIFPLCNIKGKKKKKEATAVGGRDVCSLRRSSCFH